MLGMVGRSGWRLEMGSARHCLAAGAGQLKVNMKKKFKSIRSTIGNQWCSGEERGKGY